MQLLRTVESRSLSEISPRIILSARPNKLPDLEKGVQQAYQLARVEFSQVYFFVFVVIDTKEQNRRKFSYAGLSPELKSLVERLVSVNGLEPRIGLY